MTIKYWQTLPESTKRRAVKYAFPGQDYVVDAIVDEKPNPQKSPYWERVFSVVKNANDKWYKCCCGDVYFN